MKLTKDSQVAQLHFGQHLVRFLEAAGKFKEEVPLTSETIHKRTRVAQCMLTELDTMRHDVELYLQSKLKECPRDLN